MSGLITSIKSNIQNNELISLTEEDYGNLIQYLSVTSDALPEFQLFEPDIEEKCTNSYRDFFSDLEKIIANSKKMAAEVNFRLRGVGFFTSFEMSLKSSIAKQNNKSIDDLFKGNNPELIDGKILLSGVSKSLNSFFKMTASQYLSYKNSTSMENIEMFINSKEEIDFLNVFSVVTRNTILSSDLQEGFISFLNKLDHEEMTARIISEEEDDLHSLGNKM